MSTLRVTYRIENEIMDDTGPGGFWWVRLDDVFDDEVAATEALLKTRAEWPSANLRLVRITEEVLPV